LLEQIWHDLAADEVSDRFFDQWVSTVSRLQKAGAAIPQFSPYQLTGGQLGKDRIRDVLEAHIDFETVPSMCGPGCPDLIVGTVDVEGGVFETFVNEEVTTEAVLASAAVPELFEAVEINGHAHWDGLFSQNPPIDDLMRQPPQEQPEELWVIQINQQEIEGEPTTVKQINDRRNELAGNISLNQELRFVERVNDWIDAGKLPAEEFTKTEISRIEMPTQYGSSSKVSRDVDFISQLLADGHEQGVMFLD
jgi:Predicted esterase of the alpha-beta hydrolase superfamily